MRQTKEKRKKFKIPDSLLVCSPRPNLEWKAQIGERSIWGSYSTFVVFSSLATVLPKEIDEKFVLKISGENKVFQRPRPSISYSILNRKKVAPD